uniref:Cyclic AMP-dependent transcription factor ATF-6 alpha n=1 Tax=Ascaris suum TaxID=6253 RepID=F1KWK1_ASCSU
MRDFDFDVDLFTTDPIDTISTDLPLCKTDIDFESKLVDEICNETSSRHSPISADSGNHSPSSTSSEAVSEVWPMSSVNPSDGATSPSANTFVFDTGRLKKDECIVRNQEDLDVTAPCPTVIDSKDGKTAMEIKPLVTAIHTPTSDTIKLSVPKQTPTHLAPVQMALQQVVPTTSQVNLSQQPVIYLLPASSNSANVQQQQRQVYVQNTPNTVQLTSLGVREGGCMRNAHCSPSITNRVQPYPPIRPKLVIPKRETCSPPPTLPLIVTPRPLQTMSVPTTKTALLTPLSLPGGLQIIECKTAPSSSNITRNPSADSGFDEFTRKKEDRKIRNRASAQLSRIRKRNEMDEMKQKLADKDLMIATLRKENDALKGQIVQLQNENNILKTNTRRNKITGRTGAATGAACLFVMIMMVTINSPIFSRLNPISPPTESYSRQFPLDNRDENAKSTLPQHGRALLAVDYDVDESNGVKENGGLRLKRNVKEIVEITPTINVSNIAADCNETTTLYVNQTEAIRLNNDLSSWVDRHERLNFLQTRRIFRAPSPRSRAELSAENVSAISKTHRPMHIKQTRSVISRTRRSTNDKKEEARLKAVRERAWRHIDMISAGTGTDNEQSQPKLDSRRDSDLKATINSETYARSSKKSSSGYSDRSAFDLFVPHSVELQYMELARALKQRDDTLYVVAMKDYYLLPATDRNSTMRPRVALILPALSYNGTLANQVAMMRIECEIMGTGLFHIAESLLPLFYNQSFHQSGQ